MAHETNHRGVTPSGAELQGDVIARRSPSTLVEAMERASVGRDALFTFHDAGAARVLEARSLADIARRMAAGLAREGVRRGDRVLVMLPSGRAFVEVLLGAWMLGAIPVPLAAPMTFGRLDRHLAHVARVAASAAPRLLVGSARVLAALADAPELARHLGGAAAPEELACDGASLRLPSVDPDDVAFIQYTSGTTGVPRGAEITHRAISANTAAIAQSLGLSGNDVGVSWLPMHHDMGLVGVVLTALCHPYPVHLLSPERFVMQPRSWLELIARARATISVAPNFGYELCLRRAALEPSIRLDSWRAALTGAEPVLPGTLDRFADRYAEHGFDRRAFLPVYGLAEATLAVTASPHGEGARLMAADREALEQRGVARVASEGRPSTRCVSVGAPVPGVAVRIRDEETGSLALRCRVGAIEVSSPGLTRGYHGEPATDLFTTDGWLRTGDLGFVHRGELFVSGRAKDVIVQAGRNVHPQEVESVVGQLPRMTGGVAAFGALDPALGTEALWVAAECVVPEEERARTAERVRAEVLSVLGLRVDGVLLRPPGSLPRTTSGKIQRAACRELRCEEPAPLGRAREART